MRRQAVAATWLGNGGCLLVDIDAMCREASERLRLSTEARIEAFREQSKRDAEFTRRSFGQKRRWLTKQVMDELRRIG